MALLNPYIMIDLCRELMDDKKSMKLKAFLLSSKEAFSTYEPAVLRISTTTAIDLFHPFDVVLPDENYLDLFDKWDKSQQKSLGFQQCKTLIFNDCNENVLTKIQSYLPYLRRNKRLEKIIFERSPNQQLIINEVFDNITINIKEITGSLKIFEYISNYRYNCKIATIYLNNNQELIEFFNLNGLTIEEINLSFFGVSEKLSFFDHFKISSNFKTIKRIKIIDVRYLFKYLTKDTRNLANIYLLWIKKFSLLLPNLEEIQFHLFDQYVTIKRNSDVENMIHTFRTILQQYSGNVKIFIKANCKYSTNEKVILKEFCKKFPGFIVPDLNLRYQYFYKNLQFTPNLRIRIGVGGYSIIQT